jgi:NADH-quinone oxidoreductase subunit L
MLLLQQTLPAAQSATEAAHAFEPFVPWLIVVLPLLGFVINGLAAIVAARRNLPALPPVGDPYWDAHETSPAIDPSEEERLNVGVAPHPGDRAQAVEQGEDLHGHHDDGHADGHPDDHHDAHHGAAAGPKPWTHVLPSFVAPLTVAAAFAIALVNFFRMYAAHIEAPEVVTYWSWLPVGDFQVDAALQLDQLSILMTLIVTGVGALIHLFSVGYMKEDPGYPRYMAYLNLFIFFMLVLVLGASYPVMFVGWEGVGLCSYLLIGFWFSEKANADAGKKAFIVNRIGDFGFLMAMFLLFAHLGTLDFAGVNAAAPTSFGFDGAVVTLICLFFLLGAAGKSAQIPLYVWLPDAMAGPTPVSALIHAATMVTAGVYLVVRSSVLFALAPAASLAVALVGTATAIFAATIGLKQWDIKKVLAYSTVSQLGFMFAAVGMGAYAVGVFHLMTHAFFKALLFLGSGAVIHAMHHALHATHNPADAQDMRNMGGLRKYLPVTFWTMAIGTLAIAGVPPFAGFFSKDEIIGAAWLGAAGANPFSTSTMLGVAGSTWMLIFGIVLTIAAFITAFYMARMMIYTFFGANRTGEGERGHLHEGSWTLTVPLVALAALSVIGGWFNIEHEIFEHVPGFGWLNHLAIGGSGALHHWLHPVTYGAENVIRDNIGELAEPHHAAWPIFLAIAIGIGGLVAAWVMLGKRTLGTADVEPAYRRPAERVLYHKYYVDELYDAAVVRPVGAFSRLQAAFDRVVVDGLVDFSGRTAQALGLWAGRLQTGHLNTYALTMVVGVLVLLGSFMFF